VTGVEAISRIGKGLFVRREVFSGKLEATIAVPESGMVFTFAGGPVEAGKPFAPGGKVIALAAAGADCGVEPLAMSRPMDDETALEEADAVVAAGLGVGKAENLERLRAVAGILKNSALGGSRPACDAGWLPYSRQVGETGRKVAPTFYLACGISGSRQHLAGIKNARTVVAVNSDPQAAIFRRADYGIVEDLNRFFPVLMEVYKARLE
jgi:electron transfer flavoprotein alpha subunit